MSESMMQLKPLHYTFDASKRVLRHRPDAFVAVDLPRERQA